MDMGELLAVLEQTGVRLSLEGGQLQVGAPRGSITADLKAALGEHKTSLIALLRSREGNGSATTAKGLRPIYVDVPAEVAPQEGTPLAAADVLAKARALAPELRRRSEEIERARRLPADVAGMLREAGVFRMNMPRIWGGPEMTPMQQNEVIEELSRANASVGWCTMIGADSGIVSAYLDDEVARRMYPRLDMVQAGWYQPVGTARRVKGGYRVSGKWKFASGCTHSDWMSAGCYVVDEHGQRLATHGGFDWRVMIASPSEFELVDTWYTTGLQGSGSLDYQCEDLFVPEERTFSFFDTPRRAGTLYCCPDTYLRKMPGIPLGIARDAIDTVVAGLAGKREVPSGRLYREQPRVQSAIAQAEGLYGAARSFLYSTLSEQWEKLEAREPLGKRERANLWLSRINVFQSARQVVQLMYDTMGGSAIYSASGPLDRHLRDVNTICQHIVGQVKSWEPVGAMLLDPDGDTQVPFL